VGFKLAAKAGYGRTVLNIHGKGIPNEFQISCLLMSFDIITFHFKVAALVGLSVKLLNIECS